VGVSVAPLEAALAPETLALVRRLGEAAQEAGARLWLVGGAVRDALAGRPALDPDLTAEMPAADLAPVLARACAGRVGTVSGFGTVKLTFAEGSVDLATTRTETYAAPGALPTVRVLATIAQDMARRDFTINAMAASLAPGDFGALLDPQGGRADLEAGLVRVLHPQSFQDDATRTLRAVRYAVRLGLAIEPATLRWLRRDARHLAAISPARVRREVERTLVEPAGARMLREAHRLGLLAALHPALGAPPVGGALARAARAGLTGLALWGAVAYAVGPRSVRPVCNRLAATRPQARVAEAAARLAEAEATLAGASPGAVDAIAGGLEPAAVLAATVAAGDARTRRALARYRGRLGAELPQVGAEALMALGIPPGPALGRALRAVRAAALDGRVRTRRGALALARRAAATN
jgi:tRNA nucleotidyltransferase (CCA-adding enzyme)